MVSSAKLYERLVATRGPMRFREFQRVLAAFGFVLDRVKGSHHVYRHEHLPRPLSIQPQGNMAKPYQIDQFLDKVEQYGLELDE